MPKYTIEDAPSAQYTIEDEVPAPLSGPPTGQPKVPAPPAPGLGDKAAYGAVEAGEGFKKGLASTAQTIHHLNAPSNPAASMYFDQNKYPGSDVNTTLDKGPAYPYQLGGRVAELGAEMAMPMKGVATALPSLARSGAAIGAVEDAMEAGGHMVPFNNSLPKLARYNELRALKAPGVGPADELFTRSQAMGANGPHPMPFKQARDAYSLLGTKLADTGAPLQGKMAGVLPQVQRSFGDDIISAADKAGLGDDYRYAMAENRMAHQMRDAGKGLLKWSGYGGAGGLAAYGANEVRKKVLGR